jgi:4-amino-4-deoxychorismate lyase
MPTNCLINGSAETQLSPWDRGLAYGDGVFRTLAVRRGRPQDWHRQYRKLAEDCRALAIVCPGSELLLADIRRLCGDDAAVCVKIVVTRGAGMRGYAVPAPAEPSRILLKSPLPDYPAQNYAAGVRLHLCRLRLSRQPQLAGIKHLNRLENVLARMEWEDAQIAEGLLLDADDLVIECSMSNIFMRSGHTLRTPDLSRCGVAGVTRQRVIEAAPQLGYHVEIADMTLPELLRADEVIICNSLYGAWQVRALQDTTWPAGLLASQLCNYLNEENAAAE